MPNVHVRDVPGDVLQTLRQAAKRHGRSLNAELVDAVVLYARRVEQEDTLLERLEEVRRRWQEAFPEGYPAGMEPEAIIRRARDTR